MSCSVSIHAPTRGATDENAVIGKKTGVSIHAPTRGATQRYNTKIIIPYRVSIHAPTRGATVTITDYPTTNGEFQSTHPHGVRHRNCHSHLLRTSCFNPRTHTGCDNRYSGLAISVHKFQSTHPHGVRPTGHIIHPVIRLFQSTHPHGVRLPPVL